MFKFECFLTQFLTQTASNIYFRSTCLLMMLYFTLDFTTAICFWKWCKHLTSPHLETVFKLFFGCFLLVVTRKRTLIGWLVLEDQTSTNHWKNPNWGRWFKHQFWFYYYYCYFILFLELWAVSMILFDSSAELCC